MSLDAATTRHVLGKSRERRREEAARWFVVLQHAKLSDRVLKSWKKWESVPENREAFDAIERLWELSGAVPLLPAGAEERAADRYDGSVPVSSWRSTRIAARTALRILGLAALTAAVVFGIKWYFEAAPAYGRTLVVETGIAEDKELVFEDGTRVYVGARTSITASFSKRERSVVLEHGEALFNVARDPRRPFQVSAGSGTITALGTKFNVRRRNNDDVVVTVTEGVVEVTPSVAPMGQQQGKPERDKSPSVQRLVRGQEVLLDAQGKISPVRVSTGDTSVAWRDGHFKYQGEPLRNVIQDINRYSSLQLVLDDPAAGELLYSGTVFARDIEDWIVGLERIYPEIEVVTTDRRSVLLRTRTAAVDR